VIDSGGGALVCVATREKHGEETYLVDASRLEAVILIEKLHFDLQDQLFNQRS
jgi:hypothetical protein